MERPPTRCSSSGNCTSLRRRGPARLPGARRLQFLRELHFIEATGAGICGRRGVGLQFLRELHFIEIFSHGGAGGLSVGVMGTG